MYKRILVPTDGSELAEDAARAAVAVAKSMSASIVGFYAPPSYEESTYETVVISPGWVTEKEFNKLNKRATKKYLGAIEKMAIAAGVPYESYSLTRTHPAIAIVEAANDKSCDLICIGSHGRGALVQIFLGSVTTKVLSMCTLPVLVHRKGAPKSRTKSAARKSRQEELKMSRGGGSS